MTTLNKKILYINLANQTYETKLHDNYGKYIGGVGLGAKILNTIEKSEEASVSSEPIIFSIGPLNGYFPYASKTSVLFRHHNELKDHYLGGNLSTRIKFSSLDAIVIYGRSKEPVTFDILDETVIFHTGGVDLGSLGLPGKRSQISKKGEKYLLGDYFATVDDSLSQLLTNKNLQGFVITGTHTYDLPKSERYLELYNMMLSRIEEISVRKSGSPSCSGCPVGCFESSKGEESGNLLAHSLVACTFAQKIYGDTSIVFSCLDVLGSGYTHEDIENFPKLVYDLLEELKK